MRVKVSPEQVKKAFAAVSDDPSFEESRALAAKGKMPAEMIQALTLRPEILRAFAGFGGSVYPGGLLERRVKEEGFQALGVSALVDGIPIVSMDAAFDRYGITRIW